MRLLQHNFTAYVMTVAVNRAGFLGETLFHFLGTGEDESLFDIFDSIVRRGLLMTVGNKDGKLDRFPVQTDRGVELLEVMQYARVCFTDIPEEMLASHCEHYGKFGFGFSRAAELRRGRRHPVLAGPAVNPAAGLDRLGRSEPEARSGAKPARVEWRASLFATR